MQVLWPSIERLTGRECAEGGERRSLVKKKMERRRRQKAERKA